MALVHLGCPACGGALTMAEGQRIVACQYCGGQSLILVPNAVPRCVIAAQVDMAGARDVAQEILSRTTLPTALRRRGRVQEMTLCYVPFYEFSGIRLGSFRLREQGRRSIPQTEDGADEGDFQPWLLGQPTKEEQTRVIQQDYTKISPACDLPELGVDSIPLQALRQSASPLVFEAYDPVALQSRGIVFAPALAPERFAEEIRSRGRVEGDRTRLVEQRLRIMYYPVWQGRYLFRDRPYEIAVDGVTGSVLRARVPTESRRAVGVAVAVLGASAFGFGRLARHLLLSGSAVATGGSWTIATAGSLFTLVGGATVALLLAWLGWNAFRESADVWIK